MTTEVPSQSRVLRDQAATLRALAARLEGEAEVALDRERRRAARPALTQCVLDVVQTRGPISGNGVIRAVQRRRAGVYAALHELGAQGRIVRTQAGWRAA
jgi:hypothetical protein